MKLFDMKNENGLGTIFSVIFCLYMIISQIMTVIFFIGYCKEDSVFEIIFIDTWLSEIKGLLWIFFIWYYILYIIYMIGIFDF